MISIAVFSYDDTVRRLTRDKIQDWLIDSHTMAKVTLFEHLDDIMTMPARYDIYILDMDAGPHVIEMSKMIMDNDPNAFCVFTSVVQLNAFTISKMHDCYFIGRPIKNEEFFHLLNTLRKKVREDNIVIKTPLGERRVKVNMVNYIHIEKRCLCHHLKDGTVFDGQTLRESFEKAIGPLKDHPMFMFIAPSLLINVSEIAELHGDRLIFDNGEVMYFPKKAFAAIQEKWKSYNKI